DRGVEAEPLRRDRGDQAVDEGAQARAEGGEDWGCWLLVVSCPLQCGNEGAVGALHLNEDGHDGSDAEVADVSAEDSAEKWGGYAGEGLGGRRGGGGGRGGLVVAGGGGGG